MAAPPLLIYCLLLTACFPGTEAFYTAMIVDPASSPVAKIKIGPFGICGNLDTEPEFCTHLQKGYTGETIGNIIFPDAPGVHSTLTDMAIKLQMKYLISPLVVAGVTWALGIFASWAARKRWHQQQGTMDNEKTHNGGAHRLTMSIVILCISMILGTISLLTIAAACNVLQFMNSIRGMPLLVHKGNLFIGLLCVCVICSIAYTVLFIMITTSTQQDQKQRQQSEPVTNGIAGSGSGSSTGAAGRGRGTAARGRGRA
jgi:hypothetical protein